ncbi:MAG: FxsA family protein [Gammaproteobacteria bacterium]
MRFLFVFFIAIPLVEMLLLFEVSDQIGGLNTLGLVVLTAVIGVQVLKSQGLSTLMRANQRLESGQLPAQEIIEGMMLAGAGALLLTPGFITDTLGFIFLTGPLRRPIARYFIRSGVIKASASRGSSFSFWSSSAGPSGRARGPGGFSRPGGFEQGKGDVVEGEYSDESRPNLDSPDDDKPRH